MFKCGGCGGTFQSDWTEEESLAEMRAEFGDVPENKRICLCDECYERAKANERAEVNRLKAAPFN